MIKEMEIHNKIRELYRIRIKIKSEREIYELNKK